MNGHGRWLVATTAVMAAVTIIIGCDRATGPETSEVRLSGSSYTDFHVDSPCAEHPAPPELTGVKITFADPAGAAVGAAVTGSLQRQELPKGPGTEARAHGGCRMLAPTASRCPRRPPTRSPSSRVSGSSPQVPATSTA